MRFARVTITGTTLAAACALTGVTAASARAQLWDRLTNPRSDIIVTHPPQVVLKGVTKISVLEFTGIGRCGPELTERVSAELGRSTQFELIDRGSIDAILREQGFQASGAVSQDAAVKIGALIGPAAVFTGRVIRCKVDQSGPLYHDVTDNKGRTTRTYIRRVSAQLMVKINLIDLTTGKVIAGPLIEKSDSLANTSEKGDPERPSADAVLTRVYEQAVGEVSRMIYPWQEHISVVVYDDDKCDLKASAKQIKAGDMERAEETLRASIAKSCGNAGDKNLNAKAYHNLGIALSYSGRQNDGIAAMEQAQSLHNTGITKDAIAAVRKQMQLDEQLRQAQANAVDLGAPSTATPAKQAAVLTNKDIIDMVQAKLSDAIIVNQIRNSPCKFDTSTAALIALKQAGASDAVMLEMSDAAAKRCK